MINVNQLTAKLASLSDQALQQYAQMHKEDPYVMALAVSESGRRKAMRNAQQAQAAGQEQPKVADQEIAGMAAPMPEDVGIAQLPAGDMDFADGGIVAFADGGVMPQYGGPYGGGRILPDTTGYEGKTLGDLYDYIVEGGKRLHKSGTYEERQRLAKEAAAAKAQETAADNRTLLNKADADLRSVRYLGGDVQGADGTQGAGGAGTGAGTGAGVDMGGAGVVPSAGQGVAIPSAMTQAGIEAAYKQPSIADYENKMTEAAKAEVAAEQGILDLFRKQREELGEFGAGREARLKEREGKLAEDTAKNKGLAIFQAGLAMMGGESPNAFANISKGAIAGLAQYSSGLEKLSARQEKLFDAYDALEEARRSEKVLTQGQERDLMGNVRRAEAKIKSVAAGIAGKQFDMAENRANKIGDAVLQNARTMYEQQQATQRNAATISATLSTPERQAFASLLKKHKGDAGAAYSELQSLKDESKGTITREVALKEWNDNALSIQAQYPNVKTFDDYWTILSGSNSGFKVLGPEK